MAKAARQYVFEGMEHVQAELHPFALRNLEAHLGGDWHQKVMLKFPDWRFAPNGEPALDNQRLLKLMDRFWNDVFRNVLDRSHRSLVNELIDVRNKLAHDVKFSYDDAERALDSMRRLMEAVSAGNAAIEIGKMRDTILRTKFAELSRQGGRRRSHTTSIAVEAHSGLRPWREVVEPHPDVATGNFQQAEFAADLAKVHSGSAPDEYRNPKEFFSRTYLTEGLMRLLEGAARRLSGNGGDPVVELQTNFGGGKTHSMLALYHMVGEVALQELPGVDQLVLDSGLSVPQKINRAVVVGTSRGPQDVLRVAGGREIRTTWGDLAWQLGGKAAFELVAENDSRGVAPGSDRLEQVFRQCAPCLILIDEWIAYLRQIYKIDSLPSGSFEANLSFVQALSEAAKSSPQTLLVAALPASQIEVGGEGGQEALRRLEKTIGRIGGPWRPASQDESYEIVRRRLFQEIPSDTYMHRDNTLKQFAKLYRENPSDFPQGCADGEYRRKLEKSYPIHPDLFDHLYTSWGALEKFQRTRGVLRLMAAVIHELWMSSDPSVMIMPGSVAVNSDRVVAELLHYLDEPWQSIIAGDIDGSESMPYKIDQAAPNLNRYSATRRVARAIFLGTAPLSSLPNRGLDDRQINLGVVQPGERAAVFGDSLRRLTNQAQFLHSDRGRYWYSVTPSLNRLALDRAEQFDETLVASEIDARLSGYVNGIRDRGHFEAVQIAPANSDDVPDGPGGVRLVVLGVGHAHTRDGESEAMTKAENVLLYKGYSPRVFRNTLVFFAADGRKISELRDAIRASLAWDGIVRDAADCRLDLKSSDIALAREKCDDAKVTVQTRLREAWCYLIFPYQESAQADVAWTVTRVAVDGEVLMHASKALVSDEGMFSEIGPKRLNQGLEQYFWKTKHHLSFGELWGYLSRHTYFPRLKNRETLVDAVQKAVSGGLPGPFACAEYWDEEKETYVGLVIEQADSGLIIIDNKSVIVRPDIAEKYRSSGSAGTGDGGGAIVPTTNGEPTGTGGTPGGEKTAGAGDGERPTRFVGTVVISSERPARDFGQIVDGIVEQLTALPRNQVVLKLEIDAMLPEGLDRTRIRTLTENATALKFIDKSIK